MSRAVCKATAKSFQAEESNRLDQVCCGFTQAAGRRILTTGSSDSHYQVVRIRSRPCLVKTITPFRLDRICCRFADSAGHLQCDPVRRGTTQIRFYPTLPRATLRAPPLHRAPSRSAPHHPVAAQNVYSWMASLRRSLSRFRLDGIRSNIAESWGHCQCSDVSLRHFLKCIFENNFQRKHKFSLTLPGS